jgi:hypothetical protein
MNRSPMNRSAMKRGAIAVAVALAPIVGFVACESKPTSIQPDRTCPSVVASNCGEAPRHSGHTTHHACIGYRDDAYRTLLHAVEAADSRCTTIADCAPLPIPTNCGLWGTCVPKYVSKSETHAFEAVEDIRAGACASWKKTGCDDYVDDSPACSFSSTLICAKGTCSVDVTMIAPSSSWSAP